MPPNPFKKPVSDRHWVNLLEKETLTGHDIIFVRGVLCPLLQPGLVLGPGNLDKKSMVLKTKVAEFLNFSEQKTCSLTSEPCGEAKGLGILAQLG